MPKTITLNQTSDPFWAGVAVALNGETGQITGESIVDGVISYNAFFPIYGAEFGGIPASVCTITEGDAQ
jgi:hypothetical protein